MIKIGDKVKVIPHPSGNNMNYNDSEGFDNTWVVDMDGDIGKTFVVSDVRSAGVDFVGRIAIWDYSFPPTALAVV